MRHNDYAAVVLHADFEGTGVPDSTFHSYINALPMAKRHCILYILVGPDFRTLYDLEALALSANLVVNDNDVKNIIQIEVRQRLSYPSIRHRLRNLTIPDVSFYLQMPLYEAMWSRIWFCGLRNH